MYHFTFLFITVSDFTACREHCFRYHLLLPEDGRADTKVAKKGAVTKRIKSASAGTCKTIANAGDNAEVVSMKLAQLRDRRNFRDGEPPEANWQRIYRICFPGERIPSPCKSFYSSIPNKP